MTNSEQFNVTKNTFLVHVTMKLTSFFPHFLLFVVFLTTSAHL